MSGNGAPSLPFLWTVRVYYEDTDAAGVVYYANYLCFLERARTELLRALGYEVRALTEQGVVFPVREARIRYRAPARLGDLVTVCTHRVAAGTFNIVFEADILRGETLLADSYVECACVDGAGKLRKLPEKLRAALQHLQRL